MVSTFSDHGLFWVAAFGVRQLSAAFSKASLLADGYPFRDAESCGAEFAHFKRCGFWIPAGEGMTSGVAQSGFS